MINVQSKDWILNQLSLGQDVYAIVDIANHPEVRDSYDFTGLGVTLVPNSEISNISDISWFFQITSKHIDWWSQYEHTGILVSGSDKVRAHFSSMFMAHIDGESVLFPFYCVDYILPMLSRFTQLELLAWLNGHSCWIMGKTFEPQTDNSEINIREYWWEIKEHHLGDNISIESVRSWLWSNYPSRMSTITEQGYSFDNILKNRLNINSNKPLAVIFLVLCIIEQPANENELIARLKHEDVFEILDSFK